MTSGEHDLLLVIYCAVTTETEEGVCTPTMAAFTAGLPLDDEEEELEELEEELLRDALGVLPPPHPAISKVHKV